MTAGQKQAQGKDDLSPATAETERIRLHQINPCTGNRSVLKAEYVDQLWRNVLDGRLNQRA